jgi:ferrochelatase
MKTGVILLNLGGPDSLGAVRPFLYNLFSDRKIIRLGPAFLQKPIAWSIAARRAPKTRKMYEQIGGGSPILDITNAQAKALEEALKGVHDPLKGVHDPFKVYVGMRYWRPFIVETLRRAYEDGVRRLVALSLYPHYSRATTGSAEDMLKEELGKYAMEAAFISSWFDHPLYIEALLDTIRKGMEKFGPETGEGNAPVARAPVVLFSAHSLPVSFIKEGDPYVEEIMGTIKAVAARAGIHWRLGYQSRSGPVRWLEPSTEDVLRGLRKEGVREVLMVPISFVSDHIETLYEIDILYRGMAEEMGLKVRRADSLNTHPLLIRALGELVIGKAKEKGWA